MTRGEITRQEKQVQRLQRQITGRVATQRQARRLELISLGPWLEEA